MKTTKCSLRVARRFGSWGRGESGRKEEGGRDVSGEAFGLGKSNNRVAMLNWRGGVEFDEAEFRAKA